MAKKDVHTFAGASLTPEGLLLYNSFICHPIVEKCQGCERAQEFDGQSFCATYPQPAGKWNLGRCNFATHVKKETKTQAKVNPLKASKRASKGK